MIELVDGEGDVSFADGHKGYLLEDELANEATRVRRLLHLRFLLKRTGPLGSNVAVIGPCVEPRRVASHARQVDVGTASNECSGGNPTSRRQGHNMREGDGQ